MASTHLRQLSSVTWTALILVLSHATSLATTYYVDYADGSDNVGGVSPTMPFRHCPGDPESQGNSKATLLLSGDMVVFKGGITYLGGVRCVSSGVSYKGNPSGTFGVGRAIISGAHSPSHTAAFSAFGVSNVEFDNFEIKSFGGRGNTPWNLNDTTSYLGFGIVFDNCSHSSISECSFHDIGDWQNLPNANEQWMEGVGVEIANSGHDLIVESSEFTEIGRAAIQIQPRDGAKRCVGVLLKANNIHHFVRWGVDIAAGAPGCTINDIIIERNSFHDTDQYAVPSWLGRNGAAPHVDNIIMRIGGNPSWKGQSLGTILKPIVVRNNSFYNNSCAVGVQNSAIFLTTFGGRVLIYNNTFTNVLFHGNGAIYCQDGTDTSVNPAPDYWFINNSFYDITYAISLRTVTEPKATFALSNGSVRIENNIFYKADSDAAMAIMCGRDQFSNPTVLDYNIYETKRADGIVAQTYFGEKGFYKTIQDLRIQGYEIHGIEADPCYFDITYGMGSNSSLNNMHLRATSPAIGTGANFSILFSSDKDGIARPDPGRSWDIGAYQFPRSATVPSLQSADR